MKRKVFSAVFTLLCLAFCVLPFLCTFVTPSNEAIGNEQQTEFPLIKNEDNSFNERFLQQLGDYFSTHYAFRSKIISADAKLMSKIFGTSNLSSVTVGKDNWLYYSATLDNYLGRNLMSSREIFNTFNNLKLTQEYLEGNGIDFLFTVAPNKNTLYPEYMPDCYSKKESDESNLSNFAYLASEKGLNFCDLLGVLTESDEILYHKQDSHWNNKGALIAYNSILDSIGKPHNNYSDAKAVRTKSFYGDLAQMLYPSTAQAEYNYDYDIEQEYSFVTPTKSVEEPIIITENSNAEGRLYMYRDSFGNALLPFFANAYGSAYFTKAFPVNLALETQTQMSDTVIFEIAERNLVWFAESPPVIPACEVTVPDNIEVDAQAADVKAEVSAVNMQYISLTGVVESAVVKQDSEFILVLKDGDSVIGAFEAFTTSGEKGDYCFTAYILEEYIKNDSVEVSVVIKNGNDYLSTESINTKIEQVQI